MTCPDENVLAELARDELATAERTAIEAHLHACEACSAVVAEQPKPPRARAASQPRVAPPWRFSSPHETASPGPRSRKRPRSAG
jgi:anti-sigma factor RsiW